MSAGFEADCTYDLLPAIRGTLTHSKVADLLDMQPLDQCLLQEMSHDPCHHIFCVSASLEQDTDPPLRAPNIRRRRGLLLQPSTAGS